MLKKLIRVKCEFFFILEIKLFYKILKGNLKKEALPVELRGSATSLQKELRLDGL